MQPATKSLAFWEEILLNALAYSVIVQYAGKIT